jgi:P27 family predicted phage terminase small subunit
MGAGRPSLPAERKQLQGTDRKDRQKEVVQFNKITEVPKPEVWLDNRAKKYFRNLCQLLIDKTLLTDGNVGHAMIMAQELATYEEASREIKKSGMTQTMYTKSGDAYEQVSPWVAIRNTAQKNYRDYAALFGLDPVSAGKIGGMKPVEKDAFEAMQNKYNES